MAAGQRVTPRSCAVPEQSALDRAFVESAFFVDACRMPLAHQGASVADIFFAAFGHHPAWLKAILLARHRVGACFGLEAASTAEILRPTRAASYGVGDNIGPWPIYFLGEDELIAGRDNVHLDFRVSVLKEGAGRSADVVISTVCRTHNRLGRMYMVLIAPLHKWGLRRMLRRAAQAGRL